MWQRFNESSRSAILRAQQEALNDWRAETVEAQHLLTALLAEENGNIAIVLNNLGFPISKEKQEFPIKRIDFLPTSEIEEISAEFHVDSQLIRQIEARLLRKLRGQSTEPKLSDNVKRILELAADEAREIHNLVQGSTEIGSEHLLLGLLRLDDTQFQETLIYLPLKLESVRASVIEYLQAQND